MIKNTHLVVPWFKILNACSRILIYIMNCLCWKVLFESRIINSSINTSCMKAYISSIKWQQRDLNPQPLSSKTNTQSFSQTGQMIELCFEYLSVRCIWLYVIIMSRARFRVNLHSIVAWVSRNSLFEAGPISDV